MGIRGNGGGDGGGGGGGGSGSGGGISSSKNCGIWGGLIFEGDGSIGSVVCVGDVHVADFLFLRSHFCFR